MPNDRLHPFTWFTACSKPKNTPPMCQRLHHHRSYFSTIFKTWLWPQTQTSKTKNTNNIVGTINHQFPSQLIKLFPSTPNVCALWLVHYISTWSEILEDDKDHQKHPSPNVAHFPGTVQNRNPTRAKLWICHFELFTSKFQKWSVLCCSLKTSFFLEPKTQATRTSVT